MLEVPEGDYGLSTLDGVLVEPQRHTLLEGGILDEGESVGVSHDEGASGGLLPDF